MILNYYHPSILQLPECYYITIRCIRNFDFKTQKIRQLFITLLVYLLLLFRDKNITQNLDHPTRKTAIQNTTPLLRYKKVYIKSTHLILLELVSYNYHYILLVKRLIKKLKPDKQP